MKSIAWQNTDPGDSRPQLGSPHELNKSIVKKLDIAMRTVEARRSKAMSKLGCLRLSDLIRFWILAEETLQPLVET